MKRCSRDFRHACALVVGLKSGALLVFAADPYRSEGFNKIPDNVELDAVSAVAVGSAGQLYVLHRGEPPVLAYDAAGKFSYRWGGGMFGVAHGLRVDAEGNV